MDDVECICKKCGSKNFYFSLSDRINTILEVEDGIVKKKDTTYADGGEINYVRCSRCDAEIEYSDHNAIILLAQEVL